MPDDIITRLDPPKDMQTRLGGLFQFADDPKIESRAWEDEDGRFIEGYASTKIKDSYNDIIEPTAFESTKEEFFKYGGPLMHGHGGWDGLSAVPIGAILPDYWTIDNLGLRVRAQIANTAMGDDVWALVKMGVLKSFSIGFRTKKDELDHDNGIRTITDLRLYEISIVTIPANPETLFSVVSDKGFEPQSAEFKSMLANKPNGDNRGGSHQNTRKERKPMANTVEKTELADLVTKVADFETALDKVSGLPDQVKELDDRVGKNIKTVKEKLESFTKDRITKSEFDAAYEAIKTDTIGPIKELSDSVNRLKNVVEINRRKVTVGERFHEWKRLLPENKDKSDIELLLHTPIDYTTSSGEIFKAIHHFLDVRCFLISLMENKSKLKYGNSLQAKLQETNETIVSLLNFYDPGLNLKVEEFESKAFTSGNTNYGSDWAMTIPSPILYELYDLARVIENEFEHIPVTGKQIDFPLLTSRPNAYTGSVPTVANPDLYTPSNIGTSYFSVVPVALYTRVPVHEDMLEGDSLVAVIPVVREQIAWALSNGTDDAITNGDSASSHMDTGLTTATMYTKNAYEGLRNIATDDSKTYDTTSTSVGAKDAGFSAADLRYQRQMLADHGVRPDGVSIGLSAGGYFKALAFTEVTQPGTYGAGATWLTGALTSLDGMPVLVLPNLGDNLNASGVYDGSTTTYTGSLCWAKRGFRVFDRREIRIEFDKEIRNGMYDFVGTTRNFFKKVTPSTEYPVSYGYKITY